jgi:ferredoxin
MADTRRRVAENVEGEFFVDTTCIGCDTCRQLAPRSFAASEVEDHSYVYRQPRELQGAFRVTAYLLPVSEAFGAVVGVWGWRAQK